MRLSTFTLNAVLLAGCQPRFDENEGLVTTARVLAVKSEPAEVKPGASLALTALVAVPPSSAGAPRPTWCFCNAPKPPIEDNAVSSACLDATSLLPAGEGPSIETQIPGNACVLFGPNAAASGLRPRDPDGTGGYFQPVRLDLRSAVPTFHLQRVSCPLADASSDIATQFAAAYRPNQNPRLMPLVAAVDHQAIPLDPLPKGARIQLQVSWSADDAESYAYFERSTQSVITRREAMRVAWYASSGKLDAEATGRAENDLEVTTDNVWTSPDSPGAVKFWVVLRDSRGGTDFAEYDVSVLP